jgi:hypothetical protein
LWVGDACADGCCDEIDAGVLAVSKELGACRDWFVGVGDRVEDLSGDESFEAADDLSFGFALSEASCDVVAVRGSKRMRTITIR